MTRPDYYSDEEIKHFIKMLSQGIQLHYTTMDKLERTADYKERLHKLLSQQLVDGNTLLLGDK